MRVRFMAFAVGLFAALGPKIRNRNYAKGLLLEPIVEMMAREAVRLAEVGAAAYFGDFAMSSFPSTANYVLSCESKALVREVVAVAQV